MGHLPRLGLPAGSKNVCIRGQQAIQNVNVDASIDGRGQPFDVIAKAFEEPPTYNFITKLWDDEDNKDARDKFLNNKLCHECATKGNEEGALEAYRTYAVQDYFYLIDYVKFKALRLVTIPQDDLDALKAESESVSKDYGYTETWHTTCIKDLGIDESRFKEDRSVAELAYANFLQNNSRVDDWFNLDVILIVCLYGWSKLALELYKDPKTIKGNRPYHELGLLLIALTSGASDSKFYNTWIKDNLDLSDPNNPDINIYAKDLSIFLDANQPVWTSQQNQKEWSRLFRTALRQETALFDSGYNPYGA